MNIHFVILDSIFRQKINLEFEAFRSSMNMMLNEQHINVQHLLKLAAEASSSEQVSEKNLI